MKIFLALLTILALSAAEICSEPQRTFYMSFPALGKRDALTNLFANITKAMTPLDNNYTDNALQANFKIPGLIAGAYYNDHHQIESYLEKFKVNVSMGSVAIGSNFNYTITYASTNKSGTIFAKGMLDSSYFTKNLKLTEGFLQWQPDVVPALTFTQPFNIESSTPKLTEQELNIFYKMINNQAGSRKLKADIANQINAQYGPLLKTHLNHEELISTNNVVYKYRNITLNIQNVAKQFLISNSNTKGLVSYFMYGLPSSTENCTVLGKDFQDQYGGLQEIISFGVIRSMIKEALTQGLFDVNIDNSWDVSTFQFYMGDLGNAVPYANYAPANDKFVVQCKFDASRQEDELKISRYDEHDIYLTLPEICQIIYQNKPIIKIDFDISIVVRLVGAETTINTVVINTGTFSRKYTSIDPNYKIEESSQTYAQISINQVLKGLHGKNLFGSKFPTLYRRYPVIRVFDDRIIIFDPSEQ